MKDSYKLLHAMLQHLFDNPNDDNVEGMEKALLIGSEKAQLYYQVLIHDGYVEYASIEDSIVIHLFLNIKGIRFLISGGYEEVERKEQLTQKQILSTLETNQSVQSTNELQKTIGKITVWSSLVTLLFIGTSTYFQYADKSEEQLKAMETELSQLNIQLKMYLPTLKKDTLVRASPPRQNGQGK